MKKLLCACALTLPFLALPSDAKAFCIGGYEFDTGARVWCNVKQMNCYMPQAGPWYLYWPYAAHFQTPAPGVSPFFPAPQTLPPGFGQGAVPPPPAYHAAAPAYPQPAPAPAPGYQAAAPAYAPPALAPGYRAPMPNPYAPQQVGYYPYYGR
jgi:hypothetical protein